MPSTASTGSSSDESLSQKQPIPTWLPISLLAVTTAALTIPIFHLRRHRAKTLLNLIPPKRSATLGGRFTPIPSSSSPAETSTRYPPPRRRGGSPFTGPASISTKTPAGRYIVPPTSHPRRPTAPPLPEEEGFNALYGAGALGIATFLVGASALVGVWGIRTFMEVDTLDEFTRNMRRIILTKSTISQRIHRQASPEELPSGSVEEWTWPEAEKRIYDAMDKGDAYAWAEVALVEIENEAEKNRRERGIYSIPNEK